MYDNYTGILNFSGYVYIFLFGVYNKDKRKEYKQKQHIVNLTFSF